MMVALGTAGDVFPMIGFGRALQQRGHEVHMASMPQYKGAVQSSGLVFQSLDGLQGVTDDPDFYHATRSMRVVAQRFLIPAVNPVYELISSLEPERWTILANLYAYGARIAQEKHGFRLITCVVTPFSLRSVQHMPVTPGIACPQWAPSLLRRAFFALVSRLWDRELGPSLGKIRESAGLAGAKNLWYEWCLSPERVIALFPEWFAPRPSDWPAQLVYAGFTVFDQGGGQAVPAELLEPGDPLVIFAAGSAGPAAIHFFRTAVAVSSGRPWRAILLTGKSTGGLDTPLPANVHQYEYIPMSQLFPFASVVVHHGGLGTISLALMAGVPQIAVPFGHDQYDNAARIEQLGVGRAVRQSSSNFALRLRSAIEEMLCDQSWSARCQKFKQKAASSSSLSEACEQIEADYSALHR
ncbi:MAG TPA: nucleotide disphospho-sugar-binding domain-containing protein [Bryobacteraceae bacterium]|nr:nucleotide disphospho-sugar-binding domain-containing protein [Bryobacteraceae bacterium]